MDIFERFRATAENPNGFSKTRIHEIDDYMSYSRIKQLNRSPGHFKMRYIDGIKPEQTPAMAFGKAVHMAVLDPQQYRKVRRVKPDKRRIQREDLLDTAVQLKEVLKSLGLKMSGTKAELERRLSIYDSTYSKRLWSNIIKEYEDSFTPDSLVLNMAEAVMAFAMKRSILRNEVAKKFVTKGFPEVHGYWWDEALGVQWYVVIDYLRHIKRSNGEDAFWVTELKTTRDASPHGFSKEIDKMSYHLQNIIYYRVIKGITGCETNLVQVAVDNERPYGVAVYKPDERVIETAMWQLGRIIQKYNECRASNYWPVYDERIMDIGLPNYAYWRVEEEAERELPTT